jgi:hypothetical protein
MAKPKTLFVFPNPYGHIDHNGDLAGGCQEAEEPRAITAMPANRKIGATLTMVEGSLVVGEQHARGDGYPRGAKADYEWRFDAQAPIAIQVTPNTESFYHRRFSENGTPPCLFKCEGPEDLPLEKLARARIDAIAMLAANQPDVEINEKRWEQQFPLDPVVADLAKDILAKEKADAEDAKQEAKKAADAEASAKTSPKAETQPTVAQKALEIAKKKFAVASRNAKGAAPQGQPSVTPSPEQPPGAPPAPKKPVAKNEGV